MTAPTPQPMPAYVPERPRKDNGLAVAGFVLGLLGFLGSFVPLLNIPAIVIAVVGLILGIFGITTARKAGTGKGLAVSGVVLAALAIVIGILVNAAFAQGVSDAANEADESVVAAEGTSLELEESLNRADGSATEDLLADDLTVEIGSFEGQADEFGTVTAMLPVTVKNTADGSHSYTVQVEAVDASGESIAQDYAATAELVSGQSESFDLFRFVTEDEFRALEDADFQIVEVRQY